MICVREDHVLSDQDAVNTLVSVKLDGDDAGGQVLAAGNDFYSSPRLSPDGSRLAWLTWNHPNMPWDGTELWLGDLNADGTLGQAEKVAGGLDESIGLPEWSPEGACYAVSDRTGWWNLYRWLGGHVEPLCPKDAEFGLPQWVWVNRCTDLTRSHHLRLRPARYMALASLDPASGSSVNRVAVRDIGQVLVAGGQVVLRVGSPTEPTSIVRLDLATRRVRSSGARVRSSGPGLSVHPQAVLEFPTGTG
jgi:hypothetical protein